VGTSSNARFLSVDMSNADTIELPEDGGVRMPLPKFALSGKSSRNSLVVLIDET
jgi:hypothetical protein